MDYFERCVCPRDRWEPILSPAGVLGQQCKDCLRVVRWTGECSFCGVSTDHVIYKTKRAFCSDECYREERVARDDKKLESARATKRAQRKEKEPSLFAAVVNGRNL